MWTNQEMGRTGWRPVKNLFIVFPTLHVIHVQHEVWKTIKTPNRSQIEKIHRKLKIAEIIMRRSEQKTPMKRFNLFWQVLQNNTLLVHTMLIG